MMSLTVVNHMSPPEHPCIPALPHYHFSILSPHQHTSSTVHTHTSPLHLSVYVCVWGGDEGLVFGDGVLVQVEARCGRIVWCGWVAGVW